MQQMNDWRKTIEQMLIGTAVSNESSVRGVGAPLPEVVAWQNSHLQTCR